MARLTEQQADELAVALDLDVDEVGVCHACLSFVCSALDGGDEADIRRTTARISRDLWLDGFALPLQAALVRARRRGAPNADAALADVARDGPRSRVVRAVVRALAAELSRRTRADLERLGLLRPDPTVVELRPKSVQDHVQ